LKGTEPCLPKESLMRLRAAAVQTRVRPWRASGFAVTETQLAISQIDPAHDGLRIAQISDIHVGAATSSARIASAIEVINRGRPDLVFLTGDYVTHSAVPIRRIPSLLGGLEAPVYCVLGNHDHWVSPAQVKEKLASCGYRVLQNEHAIAQVKGAPLAVVGIDDGLTGQDDVRAALHGAPSSGTRLVLAHTPPTADKLPADAGLIQFSGHTHGGQFVVPGVTRAIFKWAGQPYVRGLYRVRGNLLYVNRGLGFGAGGPLLRLGSHPEVAFFTLRRSA
jgi:predicted MPP superfamily phosphohydrolase